MTITDEQLESKEREIAEIIGGFGAPEGPDAAEESERRIARIVRRAKLESLIEETSAFASGDLGRGLRNLSDAIEESDPDRPPRRDAN